MHHNLLILGGTRQASALATHLAAIKIPATLSYAGRVARVKPQAINMRIGGFGGPDGLAAYLRQHNITHLIDATHPFAAQISKNACRAAEMTGLPLIRLTRPSWEQQQGDKWYQVPDIDTAVRYLDQPKRRVMLALGRLNLGFFEHHLHHYYLLRLVDAPETDVGFVSYDVVISRGPFSYEDDLALLKKYDIDLIISKNAGGDGASAKLDAARTLGIEVVMIARPDVPDAHEVTSLDAVMDWLYQPLG